MKTPQENMKIKIGTIEQELKKCHAAFAAHPNATWAWCCHHEIHYEPLTEPAENRIAFILSSKSKSEQAVRLLNFRPCKDVAAVKTARDAYVAAVKTAKDAYVAAVKPASDAYNAAVKPARDAQDSAVETARDAQDSAVETARHALRKLHKSEWPDNTWNGKSIFKESK